MSNPFGIILTIYIRESSLFILFRQIYVWAVYFWEDIFVLYVIYIYIYISIKHYTRIILHLWQIQCSFSSILVLKLYIVIYNFVFYDFMKTTLRAHFSWIFCKLLGLCTFPSIDSYTYFLIKLQILWQKYRTVEENKIFQNYLINAEAIFFTIQWDKAKDYPISKRESHLRYFI